LNDEKLKDDITVWEDQYGIEVKGTKEENYGRELLVG